MKRSLAFKYIAFTLMLLILFNVQVFAVDNTDAGYSIDNTSDTMSTVSETVYGVEDDNNFTYSISTMSTATSTVSEIVYQVKAYYKNNKPTLDNWEEIVSLKLAGEDFKASSWDLTSWDQNSLDTDSPATAYAGRILALIALGEAPSNYHGRNLLQELTIKQQQNGSFGGSINNTVWAIIALDEAGVSYNKEKAVEYLMSQKKSDGGFALSGTSGDPDITGEALLALSKHRDKAGVSNVIHGAIEFLKNVQLESAGFTSWGSENSQSSARVITGLLAVGENILDVEWQKEGKTIIDALAAYLLPNNSFKFSSSGNTNAMATRQALRALAELEHAGYGDYKPGSGSGGTPSEPEKATVRVRVEGLESSLADETVIIEGTAFDALIEAVGSENVVAPGGLINSIKGESGQSIEDEGISTYWMYYVIRDGEIEQESFNQGASNYHVENGDVIVFYIGALDDSWNSKTYFPVVTVSPASPTVGQSVTINISEKKYTWSGLQDLTSEERAVIGDYTVKIGEIEHKSHGGQVTIPNVAEGTLQYTIRNQSDVGYPNVVTYKESINVSSGSNGGGDPTSPDEIEVSVEIIGKNNQTHFSRSQITLPKNKANVFEALKATGVSYKTRDNNSYVYEIAGEREDLTGTAGWKYKVGSSIPGGPAIDYTLKDGDSILWFWAGDYTSTSPGGGAISPQEEQAVMKEIQESIADAIKKLEEAFKSFVKGVAAEEFEGSSIVIGKDNSMTESQKKALQSLLEENIVSIQQKVEIGKESIVTDLQNEVILKIVKDVLNKEVEITIEELEMDENILLPETHEFLSSIYEFGPKGTVFNKPVYLSIRTAIPDGVNHEDILLAWYNEEKGQWVILPTVVDSSTGTVTGSVEHFTKFSVLVRKSPAEELQEEEASIQIQFEDVDEVNYPWAVKEISDLAEKGIIKGVGNNRFAPAREVNRAEFATLLVKVLDIDYTKEYQGRFQDVSEEDWYAVYVEAAAEMGIITGLTEHSFAPYDKLTRKQAAVMIAKILEEKEAITPIELKDASEISPWALDKVVQVMDHDIFKGFPDETFGPKEYVTRAQSAVLIHKLLME
ncbi:S-layer homology domain-containing protein [Anaerovirgula multivorans]|uniref:S-layer homology domain-containing protein n=1 Tax=Anaerovirgula multivorans TaxID=312168 RepID=A0A239C7S8_9FIRM|nr:S-layer homology domain-containing protein [Anaerovirgula multivorans]SNS16160.1 S-layer homology domain-containing protein [Anaerovirgula multivorans]